ncbi:MAG: amidohydrolase family protein [Bacteroidota bacterium]
MKNNIAILALSLAVAVSTASASDYNPAAKQKKPIALVGGTIHTVSGAVIENGTVVFDKGKIISLGVNIAIPANAERMNVAGKHVFPGLIDAANNLGLSEVSLGAPGTVDASEVGLINPNVRAEVAVNPESEHIPVARSGGVTVVVTYPGGGLISGLAAAMMMDGWTWEDMTLQSGVGLVITWPSMVFSPSPFSQQTRESWRENRDNNLKSIREAFAEARAYMNAKKAEQGRGVPYHDVDPRWAAMIPVLEGKMPVLVNAAEITQIQSAIQWAEQEMVKLVIVGGRDAWRISDQLKAAKIPVIFTDVQNGPNRRWEDYDQVFKTASMLSKAGVPFCITGDRSGPNARNLPHHAANAAAYGLAKDEALKSITLYPAQILGIADRVGSLEVGKDATLLVTTGDILEITTNVEQAFIQGKKLDMRDKHKNLYDKYKEKYRQLSEE